MDSVHMAVAGIALFVTGVVGFALVMLFFGATAIRHAVVLRIRPTIGRVAGEARGWLAPPERRPVALVRVPSQTAPRRR